MIARELGRDLSPELAAQLHSYRAECEGYRDLFENARDAIYVHDLNGRYTSVNTAGEVLTGFTRAEILQMSIADSLTKQMGT